MSTEAETRFLECILTKPELFKEHDIKPDDFLRLDYSELYTCLTEFDKLDGYTDAFIFMDYLSKTHDNSDLFLLCSELIASSISSDHSEIYANAIKRDSMSAQLANKLESLSEMARDFGEYSIKYETVINEISKLQEFKHNESESIKELMMGFVDEMHRRAEIDGIDGLETGFKQLDERYKGLKKQDLIILAGRPSQGKTTLALNIADKVALDGHSVQIFSLEMSSKQLIDKTIANVANVSLNEIKSGRPNQDSWDRISNTTHRIKDCRYFINERAHTVQQIAIEAKRTKLKHGLDLIVIDYLQLISGEGENRVQQVSQISRELKALAKELDIPIICLSQLNRGVESRTDKRPVMSDLRESGAIEQDADLIIFVYRDEYYYPEETQNKGVAEIITSKHRNGEVGKDALNANLANSKFSDLTAYNYLPHEERKPEPKRKGGFNATM